MYSNGIKRISINEKALTGIAEGDFFESAVTLDEHLWPSNTAYIFLPYTVSGQVGVLNVRIYPNGTTAVYAYGRTLATGEPIFTDGLWM